MITRIALKGIKFFAFHGVSEQERKVGNHFEVDVLLTAPLQQAVDTDSLEFTINYATVYEVVKAEMAIPSQLLEHVGGRILAALKAHFPQLTAVELAVTKCCPPFGGDITGASVILIEKFEMD